MPYPCVSFHGAQAMSDVSGPYLHALSSSGHQVSAADSNPGRQRSVDARCAAVLATCQNLDVHPAAETCDATAYGLEARSADRRSTPAMGISWCGPLAAPTGISRPLSSGRHDLLLRVCTTATTRPTRCVAEIVESGRGLARRRLPTCDRAHRGSRARWVVRLMTSRCIIDLVRCRRSRPRMGVPPHSVVGSVARCSRNPRESEAA